LDVEDFVTAAGRWPVFTPKPHPPWEEALDRFLLELARRLRDAGCAMIGHIKGMLGDAWADPLYFSLTSFTGPPHFRGGSPDRYEEQDLSVNVIVAGIDRAEAARVLESAIHDHFHTPGI
jgi:hypothetical protein